MIITQTDLASARIASGRAKTDGQILAELIAAHKADAARIKALDGDRYCTGDQDIKNHDFATAAVLDENDVAQTFKNPNASNIRTQHRFLPNQIEQKVSYIAGKEPSVTVDGAEASEDGKTGNAEWLYQTELTNSTDCKFRKRLLQWLRKASKHGVAWLHEYKDKGGVLCQVVIGRDEGIPIYDTTHEQDLVEFIRWYSIEVYVGGKSETRVKAEWWTDNQVTYWLEASANNFIPDPDHEINPAPHFWEVVTATGPDGVTWMEKSRTPKSWGRVPFIELSNNSDKITDLDPIKDLIDAYDLVASKGTNNLMDFNEFFAVVNGFGGDTAAAIMKKLQVNRAIAVKSTGGSIEMKQLDLQMEGRINWLQELWDAIHVFGMAVDTTNDKLGSAPSGVSLKFQYTLLDLKANNMIVEAELAIKEHLRFISEELTRKTGVGGDPEAIRVSFNKTMITNDAETVNMIIQSDNLVPERILLAAHPLVDDTDQAYKDLLAQRQEKIKLQRQMMPDYGTLPNDDGDDDGNTEP